MFYRHSFYYERAKKILFIRKERLESIGEFILVIVHCLSHIANGDLADDSQPMFLRYFYKVSRGCYFNYNHFVNGEQCQTILRYLVDQSIVDQLQWQLLGKTLTYRPIGSCPVLPVSPTYLSVAHSPVANHRITSLYRGNSMLQPLEFSLSN